MRAVIFLIVISVVSVVVSFLERKELQPRISEITLGKKDKNKVKNFVNIFSNNTGYRLLSSTKGNFAIKITAEVFGKDDLDSIAYAIIGNSECQISLNLKEKWNKTKFELVLFHELGHCFGLDHDAGISVMDADYEDEDSQIKSLPSFFKKVKSAKISKYHFNSGIDSIDTKINSIIDPVIPVKRDEIRQPPTSESIKDLDWE